MGVGYKSQIAQKLVERIQLVTKANGYSQDVQTVRFDKVRLNLADYQDYEIPAVQIIDTSKVFKHEFSRSKSSWFLAVEAVMRTTETIGEVDQQALWDFEEDIIRSIMAVPNLGLSFLQHVKLVDSVTDLHLQEPNYLVTLGLEIMYYEPITGEC